jgi:hypothetical protein
LNPALLEILGTLESQIGVNHSRLVLMRDLHDIGLIYELNALWRVLVTRADLHQWIATLTLTRERSRSIALRYSPLPDASEPERARERDLIAVLVTLRRD